MKVSGIEEKHIYRTYTDRQTDEYLSKAARSFQHSSRVSLYIFIPPGSQMQNDKIP